MESLTVSNDVLVNLLIDYLSRGCAMGVGIGILYGVFIFSVLLFIVDLIPVLIERRKRNGLSNNH